MRDQLEWRLDPPTDPEHNKPGHDLSYARYDKMARRWAATPSRRLTRRVEDLLREFGLW